MIYTNSDFKIISSKRLTLTNKLCKYMVKSIKLQAHRNYNAKAGAYLYIFKHLVIILFIRYTPAC